MMQQHIERRSDLFRRSPLPLDRRHRAAPIKASSVAVGFVLLLLQLFVVFPTTEAKLPDRSRLVQHRNNNNNNKGANNPYRDNGHALEGHSYRVARRRQQQNKDAFYEEEVVNSEPKQTVVANRERPVAPLKQQHVRSSSSNSAAATAPWKRGPPGNAAAAKDSQNKNNQQQPEISLGANTKVTLEFYDAVAAEYHERTDNNNPINNRELSSQLSGCCYNYKSYSASKLCSLYGNDCESGSTKSHDSGDGDCSQNGLSFIGLSFSVNTASGNPYSYQLCDQFPMENIIDRDYEYVMSLDEDGWLVGGGYKTFDYSGKMPYVNNRNVSMLCCAILYYWRLELLYYHA